MIYRSLTTYISPLYLHHLVKRNGRMTSYRWRKNLKQIIPFYSAFTEPESVLWPPQSQQYLQMLHREPLALLHHCDHSPLYLQNAARGAEYIKMTYITDCESSTVSSGNHQWSILIQLWRFLVRLAIQ